VGNAKQKIGLAQRFRHAFACLDCRRIFEVKKTIPSQPIAFSTDAGVGTAVHGHAGAERFWNSTGYSMQKVKNWTGSAALLAALLGATACGGGADSRESSASAPQVVKSSLSRITEPEVSDADLRAVVAGSADFAVKTLARIDPEGASNAVFSPYSLTQALAMAAAGAKGTTLSEMQQALGLALPQDRLNPALNKLDLMLAAKTPGAVDPQLGQLPQMTVSNAVWAQQGYTLLPEYLDTVARHFGAGIRLLDFKAAAEPSRLAINAHVEEQTRDLIKNLLPQGAIRDDTRVVLTNAIWFKANWAAPFDVALTAAMPFTQRNGALSEVPFMRRRSDFSAVKATDYQAVELPYVGGKLAMQLVMPTAGSFDRFLADLSGERLEAINRSLQPSLVELAMPKFEFTADFEPTMILQSFGMVNAFDDTGRADFSGIDGTRNLYISRIVHKAFVGVDEKGTEAAAATGVVVGVTSVDPRVPLVMHFDHPYIFLIRDRQTGLILFMGKVLRL